jgi:hypothetical protein
MYMEKGIQYTVYVGIIICWRDFVQPWVKEPNCGKTVASNYRLTRIRRKCKQDKWNITQAYPTHGKRHHPAGSNSLNDLWHPKVSNIHTTKTAQRLACKVTATVCRHVYSTLQVSHLFFVLVTQVRLRRGSASSTFVWFLQNLSLAPQGVGKIRLAENRSSRGKYFLLSGTWKR